MVRWIVYFIFFFAVSNITAQDLIIKRSGESIYCNIEEVTDYFVHFYEIEDVKKELLFKMDVALIETLSFADRDASGLGFGSEVFSSKVLGRNYSMLETNIDGLFRQYGSLHYQLLSPKFAFDIGFKRYIGRDAVFISAFDDRGSMVEVGLSIPMKMFSAENREYRGLYLRGFGIYGRGSFISSFQNFFTQEYSLAVFGAQGVLAYQVSDHFYFKLYYGLGGTVDINNFRSGGAQADVSASGGIQNISGLRVGYMF